MKLGTPNVPEAILAGIFGLALLGQFARVATPLGMVNWHEPGLLLFIVTIMPGIWRQKRSLLQEIAKQKYLILLAAAFITWTAVTTVLNAQWLDSSLLLRTGLSYLARLALYLIFSAAVWSAVRNKQVRPDWLGFLARWWLIMLAMAGIGQYLLFPDARLLKILGWDDHLNRAFGTLLDPGFFGLMMAAGAVWLLPQWLKSPRRWLWPVLWSTQLLGLVLSFSRASYIAYVAGILVLSWAQKSRRILLFIPLLIMALVLVPKDGGGEGQNLSRTNSVAARVQVAQYHTENLTWQEIIFGRGWYYESARQLHQAGVDRTAGGVVDTEAGGPLHAQAVDNSYLHVFLSTGAIGFTLFLGGLGLYLKKIGRSTKLAVLAAVLTHGFFSTALFYPWVLLLLAIL
jgi:hypothetical protein